MIADSGQGAPPSVGQTLVSPAGIALDLNVTVWNSPTGGAAAGGDWCDAVRISDDEILFTVGDVSGHGEAVAAAMEAMRSSILRSIQHLRVPSAVLAAANRTAAEHDYTIVTAIVAVFNQRLHTLVFANAGHPPPLLISENRHAYVDHPPADLPLGVFRSHSAADYVIALPRDVLMVFYTDGVTEHERVPIRGESELAQAAQHAYGHPESDAAANIAGDVFRSGRGHDDAAVMALRVRRNPGSI